MSYQVLARKWRPQNFQQVVGQPHVLTALENGLAQNRVHHAYLFSGTRGVGKTTIARIFAKSLNCEIGVTATPCGQCANCEAIDQGRFVDLLEIDAASRTKVDDTRELLDNVQYKPAQGRYKVYLIDEVHMLSKHSFNALLKTLEEPPEYVKFLLATTDPQKLPITVLSRCLQFHLKAILPEQIEHQLAAILAHENATFEQAALGVIAKAADGSMRDALSLTDQALAFGAGNIEYAAVLKMLGTIDQSHLHYLLHFIASGNSQKVFEKIQEFVHLGADFSALHQELASLCHQIALAQLQINANVTDKTAVQLLAERLTPEEVQLFYQIAVQGFKDYAYAPNGKVALEMTVMRLLAFKPANYVDIDESMLIQARHVEPIIANLKQPGSDSEPTLPVQRNTPPAVTNVIVPVDVPNPVIETILSTTQPAIDSVLPEQPQINAEIPNVDEQQITSVSKQASLQENNQIGTIPLDVAQPEDEMPIQSEPSIAGSSTVAPVLVSSNSRNMLRSHRLKREELKKTEATTEQPSRVIEQSVAPEVTTAKPTAIKPTATKPTVNANEETLSPLLNRSPVITTDKQEAVNQRSGQELPPLSSYQEQPEQTHYQHAESDVNYSGEIAYSPPAQSNKVPEPVQYSPSSVEVTTIPKTKLPVMNNDISAIQPIEEGNTGVSFVVNENIESVEIDIANYVDDKMTDDWFLAIKAMQLVGFEKLLAKSTVMEKAGDVILLTLHHPQQHLLNNHSLCEDLKTKLRGYYGQEFVINIEAGQVVGRNTPMALEQIVYLQYLDNAKSSIKADPIIQMLVRDYAAKIYENSVVPL